jgi:hypothetical protein
MADHLQQAQQWLDREDLECRRGRIERLVWLASVLPRAEFLTFPGGWMAKHLYEEARYCFVYAQFLAAIVLGFAFVEHTLAALFYASGRNDLERAPASSLLQEAVSVGWLSPEEHAWLQRARGCRNPVTRVAHTWPSMYAPRFWHRRRNTPRGGDPAGAGWAPPPRTLPELGLGI